jgi:putative effector of murein hydrolase
VCLSVCMYVTVNNFEQTSRFFLFAMFITLILLIAMNYRVQVRWEKYAYRSIVRILGGLVISRTYFVFKYTQHRKTFKIKLAHFNAMIIFIWVETLLGWYEQTWMRHSFQLRRFCFGNEIHFSSEYIVHATLLYIIWSSTDVLLGYLTTLFQLESLFSVGRIV